MRIYYVNGGVIHHYLITLRQLNMPYKVYCYDRVKSRLLVKEEMSKKLEQLLLKQEQLKAQIRREKNKHSQHRRKQDTRRKILLGALMMDLMKKGELDEKKILKKLDKFLTKDIDRKLFDFR